MGNKKKTSQGKAATWLTILLFMVIGGICGLFMGAYLDAGGHAGLLQFVLLILGLYATLYLHIIFHEGGHLLFGLLTGYRFSSFRIGSLMLLQQEGKLRLRRFSLAGTGGQCLLVPPQPDENGKIPVTLYNLGGCIVNLALAVLCAVLLPLTAPGTLLRLFLQMSAVIGAAFALINGLPLRLTAVDNDGRNTLVLCRSAAQQEAFRIQMLASAETTRGRRMRDMPESWFDLPAEAAAQGSMTAAVVVFRCNQLMDQHRFDEADVLMVQLLKGGSQLVGVHRSLLICDRIFCLTLRGDRDAALALADKPLRQFMKSMKAFPSILRTQYVLALLEQNGEAAQTALQRFDAVTRSYPYTGDIETERELLELARQAAEGAAQ